MPARRIDERMVLAVILEHPSARVQDLAEMITARRRAAEAARLGGEHPSWSPQRCADEAGGDERLAVTAPAVSQVISRHQHRWARERPEYELRLPRRYRDVLPWGLPPEEANSPAARKLRVLASHAAGARNRAQDLAAALEWERKLRHARTIIDITYEGRLYSRPARAGELTPEGELPEGPAGLVARPPADYGIVRDMLAKVPCLSGRGLDAVLGAVIDALFRSQGPLSPL